MIRDSLVHIQYIRCLQPLTLFADGASGKDIAYRQQYLCGEYLCASGCNSFFVFVSAFIFVRTGSIRHSDKGTGYGRYIIYVSR
jgi:hypothetical protein